MNVGCDFAKHVHWYYF